MPPPLPPGSFAAMLDSTPWLDVRNPCRPDLVPPKIDPNTCDPPRARLPLPLALLPPPLLVESLSADKLLVELLPPMRALGLTPKMCRIGAMPQLLPPPPPPLLLLLLLPVGDGASAGLIRALSCSGLARPPLPPRPLLPLGELMEGSASDGKLPVDWAERFPQNPPPGARPSCLAPPPSLVASPSLSLASAFAGEADSSPSCHGCKLHSLRFVSALKK